MTYDLLNWLANLGGLSKWLMMAGTFIVSSFANMYLTNLIGNRFYVWNPPATLAAYISKDSVDEKGKEGEKSMGMPRNITCKAFVLNWVCCWCKPKWYREYTAGIGLV